MADVGRFAFLVLLDVQLLSEMPRPCWTLQVIEEYVHDVFAILVSVLEPVLYVIVCIPHFFAYVDVKGVEVTLIVHVDIGCLLLVGARSVCCFV